MNIYLELTRQFNRGRLRAVLAGGQAVVLHRLAIMSKDGDWIIVEYEEATEHIIGVLSEYDAVYRFGAPLDVRWLAGGWSSHFEFQHRGIRVRTDFLSRPPRLDSSALARLWKDQAEQDMPRVGPRELADLKKTNREKDYAVIGELARLLENPREQMLYSRSARDLLTLYQDHPELFREIADRRPALEAAARGLSELEAALDAERRRLIHANEERLEGYRSAAVRWADTWPAIAREIKGKALPEAHRIVCRHAEGLLPFNPPEGG